MKKFNDGILAGASTALIILSGLILISGYLSLFHFIQYSDSWKLFTIVFIYIYVPGNAILKFLNWHDNVVSTTVLSLLVGMAVIPFAYASLLQLEQSLLFHLFCFGLFIYVFIINTGKSRDFNRTYLESIPELRWWSGLLATLIILVLLNTSHFSDLRIQPEQGYFLRTHFTTESIFHLGIINSVHSGISEIYPYLSEHSFAYHYDMHILAKMFGNLSGLSPILVTYYFLPLFYFLLIVAVPAVLFFRFSGSIYFSLLFGFTLFSSDLSFLSILLGFPTEPLNPVIFTAPVWSIFTLNGMIPAIPLLFGAIIMFDRFFKENRWSYLFLYILFAVASFRVKSSMGPHIIGATAASLIVIHFLGNYKHWWKMLVATILSGVIIGIELYGRIEPTEDIQVIELSAFNGLLTSLSKMGIKYLDSSLAQQPFIWLCIFTVLFIVYVIGSYGARILIVKYIVDLLKGKVVDPTLIFLVLFTICGFLVSEFLFLGAKDGINNGVWFGIQSLYIAGFFAVYFLTSMENVLSRLSFTVVFIVFFFWGTISFLLVRNDNHYVQITGNQLELAKYITDNTANESIILEPLHRNRPAIGSHLSGRTSFIAIFRTFLPNVASPSVIKDRLKVAEKFYAPGYKGNRGEILHEHGIDYFIIEGSNSEIFKEISYAERVYNDASGLSLFKTVKK